MVLDLSNSESTNFNIQSFGVFDINLQYIALKNMNLTREPDRETLLKIEQLIANRDDNKTLLSFSGSDEDESRTSTDHGYIF